MWAFRDVASCSWAFCMFTRQKNFFLLYLFFPLCILPFVCWPCIWRRCKKNSSPKTYKIQKKKLLTYKILHTKNSSAKMQKKILPIVFYFFPLYFGHLRRVYTVAFVCCICILPIVCFPFVCCPCILYVARCMLAFYHTFVFFFLPLCVLAFYHTFVNFFFALLYGPLYVVLLFSISSFALVYYALPPQNTVPFAQNTVPFAWQKLFPLHTKYWYHKTLFPLHTKSYRIVPN